MSRVSLVCSVVFFVLSAASALASDWRQKTYAHYSNNEPVQEVLRQFAAEIDSPVIISDKVKGTISGNFTAMPALKFLQEISRINGLIWYHDGQVLYIYHTGEVETSLINSSRRSAAQLVETLKNLQLWDERYRLNTSEVGVTRVSGPPRYIALVQQVADMLAASEQSSGFDPYTLQIFELKYAWADDREFLFKGKPVVVPGVATTLRDLINRQGSHIPVFIDAATAAVPGNVVNTTHSGGDAQARTGKYQNRRGGGLEGVIGQGLAEQRAYSSPDSATAAGMQNLNIRNQDNHGYVVANERLNAVMVHDKKSRMPLYTEFIRALDKPMDQVEIEVSIIDINTEKLRETGVEWQVYGKDGQATLNKLPEQSSVTEFASEITLAGNNGANIATLLPGSEDYFLNKVRLLAQEGDARILSQPTVLTIDNIEAVLDNSTTFFVRLQGDDAVDLYPVSVGSVLRVTPHIIEQQQHRQIHLDINIEDGQRASEQVDNIPAISNSVINTQALVNENSSLLIGGYFFDSDTREISKVPLLGDIPWFGRLFRSNAKEQRKLARLFLITPSVIKHSTLQSLGSQTDNYLNRQRPQMQQLLVP